MKPQRQQYARREAAARFDEIAVAARAIGVGAAEFKVSRQTMYQHFRSKNCLSDSALSMLCCSPQSTIR